MTFKLRLGRPLSAHPTDVEVFSALRRILALWRDDPERLAVAVTAYELLGYNWPSWEVEYHHPEVPSISREEASERVRGALFRRNRRILRYRAEGLILALQEEAEAANAWRLHGQQVESCVVECRVLPIEERLVRLREQEDAA